MPEARRTTRFVLAPERPVVFLVPTLDEATHLESPYLIWLSREAKLTVRNANLCCPSVGIDTRCRFPDRIPRLIAARCADPDVVGLRSRWIDLEERAAQMIVK